MGNELKNGYFRKIFVLLAVAATGIIFSSCADSRVPHGHILPSRLEGLQIGMSDQELQRNKFNDPLTLFVPEGAEASDHDSSKFPTRMLHGKWIRTELSENPELFEIPSLHDADGVRSVVCMPDILQFAETDMDEENSFEAINFGDLEYGQAVFSLQEKAIENPGETAEKNATDHKDRNKEESGKENVTARLIYDTAGNTLALGLTGLEMPMQGSDRQIEAVDITELDYSMEWQENVLRLRWQGTEAVYVPSIYNGDIKNMDIMARNIQIHNSDMDFRTISISGETCLAATFMGQEISGDITFEENGSVSIHTQTGETWTYTGWWLADCCLALEKNGKKILYWTENSSVLSYSQEDFHPLWDDWVGLCIQGQYVGNPLGNMVYCMTQDNSFFTGAELEKTMIPPGTVTEPFEMYWGRNSLHVRAVNSYDTALPLGFCTICWYGIDESCGDVSLGGVDQVRELFRMGTEKAAICDYYREFFQFGDDGTKLYCRQLDFHSPLSLQSERSFIEYQWTNPCEEILEEDNRKEAVLLFDNRNALQGIEVFAPGLLYDNVSDCADFESLRGADRTSLKDLSSSRDDVFLKMQTFAAGQGSGIEANPFSGGLLIDNEKIFAAESTELSDEGRKTLKQIGQSFFEIAAEAGDMYPLQEIAVISHTEYGPGEKMEAYSKAYAESVCTALKEFCTGGEYDSLGRLLKPEPRFYTDNISETNYEISISDNCIQLVCIFQVPEDLPGETFAVQKHAIDPNVHRLMEEASPLVSASDAEVLARYAGIYEKGSYSNPAMGLEWNIPDGWQFYPDERMQNLNGGDLADLISNNQPYYIMAASDSPDEQMVSIRLYPTRTRQEELVSMMDQNYLMQYEYDFGKVTDQFEEESLNGDDWVPPHSVYQFKWDGRQVTRINYYLLQDDALAVLGITVPDDLEMPGGFRFEKQ